MTKNIRIKIHSLRYEISAEKLAFAARNMNTENSDPPDELELTAEGVMRTVGDRTEIEYDESDISGLGGSKTTIVFDGGTPNALTMMRRGSVGVTMVFSPGLRHTCRYETGIIPFELTLMTHALENKILESGKLYVEYTTELPGGGRTRTNLSIDIRELEDDDSESDFAGGN